MNKLLLFFLFTFPLFSSAQTTLIDSLKRNIDQTVIDSNQVKLLLSLSRELGGYSEEGAIYAKQALEIAQRIEWKKGLASAYYRLGWNNLASQQFDSANIYADSAFFFSKQLKDKRSLARCHNLRAIILGNFGALDEAATEYEIAYKLFESIGHSKGKMAMLNNLGVVLNDAGRYEEALEKYLKLITYFKDVNEAKHLAQSYYNAGVSYLGLKNWEKAFELTLKSFETRKHLNELSALSESQCQLGEVIFDAQKDSSKSINVFQKELRQLGFTDVFNMLDQAVFYAESARAFNLVQRVYGVKIKGYKLNKDYEQAFITQADYYRLNDSLKLSQTNLAAFQNVKSKLEAAQQKSRILELEKETLSRKIWIRQRNWIILIASLLLITAALIIFNFQQRLTNKNLQILVKNNQLNELEKQQQIKAAMATLEGQESERTRISKDLHDGLGNLLSSIKIQLNQGIQDQVLFSQIVDEASEEVRKISQDMMPVSLQKLGLLEALEELFERANRIHNFKIHFQSFGTINPLGGNQEIMIYRICQESLNNIIKHAQAKEVLVELNQIEELLILTIEDDGTGFDLQKIQPNNSIGLRSILSRTNYLGGSLKIESKIKEGTCIRIEIPNYNR